MLRIGARLMSCGEYTWNVTAPFGAASAGGSEGDDHWRNARSYDADEPRSFGANAFGEVLGRLEGAAGGNAIVGGVRAANPSFSDGRLGGVGANASVAGGRLEGGAAIIGGAGTRGDTGEANVSWADARPIGGAEGRANPSCAEGRGEEAGLIDPVVGRFDFSCSPFPPTTAIGAGVREGASELLGRTFGFPTG